MMSFKVFCIVSCLFAMASAAPTITGAEKELQGDELKDAEKVLQQSLTKLAAGEGPYFSIDKVHSATVQIVAGSLHRFNVDLIDENKASKKCKVSIWSRPWLENGIKVTFECEGEKEIVKHHSP